MSTIKVDNYQNLAGANTFEASLTTNGYQKLPSGLIIQWGSNTATATPTAKNFPIAFPTACLSMAVTGNHSAGTFFQIGLSNFTTTQYTAYSNSGTVTYSYIAIGY